ncbi:GPI transamidase component gaa1, partial [Neolecta irregularis DAH-3]
LRAPRGDATEAIILAAPYRNSRGDLNEGGIALLMTLARYFERWSIWSKDIVFLITEDNLAGPRAWLDAYHEIHDTTSVTSLQSKAGAIQEAVILEYASTSHRFDSIVIHYDGNNGQLPNLDLVNAAVVCANVDIGADVDFANGSSRGETYQERLRTVVRGMATQGLGLPSYHGMFVEFKIDAITIEVVPNENGRLDDIQLGRTIESLTRSLNNLMERLHHAFFFYLMISTNRFASIATCLPSAMLIAASFTVTAIGMWMESFRRSPKKPPKISTTVIERAPDASKEEPACLFTDVQFALGTVSLYCFGIVFAVIENLIIPSSIRHIRQYAPVIHETALFIKTFSHFATGMCLSTLSTLNFPLALTNGVLAASFLLVKPTRPGWERTLTSTVIRLLSPLSMVVLLAGANKFVEVPTHIVEQATYGLSGIVYFCVFLPAYLAAQIVIHLS